MWHHNKDTLGYKTTNVFDAFCSKLLIKLNWFYRVKKENTPYLYWDEPLAPKENALKSITYNNNELTNSKWTCNTFWESESKSYSSWKEVHLVKRFLEYEYVVFDIFDTLIYLGVSSKTSFYQILEKEFQISHFSEMRERAEREAIGKARLKGKEITINNIYQQLKKYTGINVEEGVNKEIEVLKRISYSNIYIKNFYDMLSYSMDNIVAIDSTYYSSEQIKEVLMNKGYSKLKKIFVSNEICKAKDDGNMFPYISAELISDKIIYMGSERHKNDLAKKNGWHIWEYRNANECGNKYRPIGMSGIKADSYSAIINQHMYCGHYQHSQRRELGYKYFGVLTIGFLNWLREQCKKSAITRIEFIFGTSNILKDNYDSCYMGDGIKSDTLFFSEETAVRCLVDIEPTCFFEYYIDRKINGEYTISFYIERMGLSAIENRLVEYGIKTTDIMSLNGEIYWAFLDFIGDNLTDIKSQYEEEICSVST